MTTYKKFGSVKVFGVKKIVYHKEGSTKNYVVYKGRHIGLIKYKSIMAKKQMKKTSKKGGSSMLGNISSGFNGTLSKLVGGDDSVVVGGEEMSGVGGNPFQGLMKSVQNTIFGGKRRPSKKTTKRTKKTAKKSRKTSRK